MPTEEEQNRMSMLKYISYCIATSLISEKLFLFASWDLETPFRSAHTNFNEDLMAWIVRFSFVSKVASEWQ